MNFFERLLCILGHPATASIIGIALGVLAFRFLRIYRKKCDAESDFSKERSGYIFEIARLTAENDVLKRRCNRIGSERFAAVENNRILCVKLHNAEHRSEQLAKGADRARRVR